MYLCEKVKPTRDDMVKNPVAIIFDRYCDCFHYRFTFTHFTYIAASAIWILHLAILRFHNSMNCSALKPTSVVRFAEWPWCGSSTPPTSSRGSRCTPAPCASSLAPWWRSRPHPSWRPDPPLQLCREALAHTGGGVLRRVGPQPGKPGLPEDPQQ